MRGKVLKPPVWGGSDGEVEKDTCRFEGQRHILEEGPCWS